MMSRAINPKILTSIFLIFLGSGISNFFNKIIPASQGDRCNHSTDGSTENSVKIQVLPGKKKIRYPGFR